MDHVARLESFLSGFVVRVAAFLRGGFFARNQNGRIAYLSRVSALPAARPMTLQAFDCAMRPMHPLTSESVNMRETRPLRRSCRVRRMLATAGLVAGVLFCVLPISAQTPTPDNEATKGFGVTLITHGWTSSGVTGTTSNPPWLFEMGIEVQRARTVVLPPRTQAGQPITVVPPLYFVLIDAADGSGGQRPVRIFTSGGEQITSPVQMVLSEVGGAVILVNWTAVSFSSGAEQCNVPGEVQFNVYGIPIPIIGSNYGAKTGHLLWFARNAAPPGLLQSPAKTRRA